jgi:hypothetical protein
MNDLETEFAVHEAICAERYERINERLEKGAARMTRIEYLIYVLLAFVLMGPGVAAQFVHKLFGI